MSRRTVALVVSVVLAAIATVALISYVRGLENKAFEGTKTVTVFVAKDTIAQGTTAEFAAQNGLFEKTVIPQKVVASGAIGSLDEIKGRVAGVNILKGEQIVAARFVAPGTQGGGLPIAKDKVAMSVQVDQVPGVAGFVQPGSRISIIGHLDLQPLPGATGSNARTIHRVQFILQDIEVLAIGPRVVTVQGQQPAAAQQAGAPVLATLALTPAQAEKLVFFRIHGDITFTLLPQGAKPTRTTGRTQDNAFS
jgi:pilus assembly protein CpaB